MFFFYYTLNRTSNVFLLFAVQYNSEFEIYSWKFKSWDKVVYKFQIEFQVKNV